MCTDLETEAIVRNMQQQEHFCEDSSGGEKSLKLPEIHFEPG